MTASTQPSGRTGHPPPVHKKVDGALRVKGIQHLDRIEYVIAACAIAAVACLVASIALLCLAQAEYVSPYASLYAFGGAIATFFVIKAIECCVQKPIAEKHHINLREYYAVKQSKKDPDLEED